MKHPDEHFIPGTSRITEIESFHRYHAAASLCSKCRVLDAASGDGYGSAILASQAARVWGIDQNKEAVTQAAVKYQQPNLSFLAGDVEEMPFENASFDRVVSFETIEHLIDQRKFLSEVRRVLAPEGVLILSSPNKSSFRARNRQENLYHINELEPETLLELIREFFPNAVCYGQDAFYNSVISGSGESSYFVRDNENNVLQQNSLDHVQYSIIIASAGELPSLAPSSFLDAVYDPGQGYLWDDESVPLQFGLRGEFERQSAELNTLREQNLLLAREQELRQEECSCQLKLIDELQQTNRKLLEESESKTAENLRQTHFISNIQLVNQRLCDENSSGLLRNKELLAQIEELQQLKHALTEENLLKENQKNMQSVTIEELRSRNDELTEQFRYQSGQNQQLNSLLETMQQENQRLASEIASQNARCDHLQQLAEEQKQLNEALSRKNEAARLLSDNQAGLIEKLQQENHSLAEELGSKAAENTRQSRLLENIRQENQRLSDEAASRNSRYASLEKEFEELKCAHADVTEKHNSKLLLCARQSQTIEELDLRNRSLCSEKEKFIAENGRLSNIITQTEQINRRLNDENSSRLLENRELIQMIAQVKKMNEQLSEEQKVLRSTDEAQKEFIAGLQQHLSELQKSLEEKSAAMDVLHSRCEVLSAENSQLQDKVRELTIHWLEEHQKAEEEHNKSEYLWGEWQEAKRSLSFRLIGQYKIRRRALNFLRSLAGSFFRVLQKGVKQIPVSYPCKEAFKERLFSGTGSLFENTTSYQTWKKHTDLRNRFAPKGDTGLIVPRDIPLTSIVIPVYNNLNWTKRCINSIYNIKSRSPFEIIVVDDCSTEDYKTLVKDFPEVRLLRNSENLGFLRTVNYGVSEARGEYVLILNNDTEVLPNWLDELTAALWNHPEAGMIGSQLIHLNTGTLQESGNLICKNGDMLPLGRGNDPDHPQFTYFREVDFCSAASIILRKKVFDEMEGFDRLYIPAYFEDPDLGLRMQKAGYKNYVCPLSRVIHQEMASYGDVLAEKCEKNRQAFLARWTPYLQEHALYADRSEPDKCMKFDRDRVLFIDAETPMADRGSGGMDSIFFMEYLIKRNCHVVFHGEYTPGYDPKYTAILLRMGVECIYQPYHKIWEYLATTGWSFTYLFICRIYQARCFDRLLKQYCPQASYIFDTVDVHFVREALEAELKDDDTLRKNAAATKEYELAAAAAADAAIVISSDEKKLLENEYHLTNVYHIPQARELFGLAPNPNRRGAVFIGSAHPPNLDGLRYFHDEILPLLPGDFKLTIIGESLKVMIGKTDEYKDLLKCRQFNFVGFVQDLGTVLDHAAITVAPLRYGAGTKGKVASSMAYGVPCVSSSFGTEGTGMVHGENIMIAGSPGEFARYIQQLFKDHQLWQKISDGGIKFIKDNYAPETVEKMMDDLFARVKERRDKGLSKWAESPVMPKVDEV